ncbi:MAG: translation elongation factor Ts [Candidatus Spechtbacteria bacterium]|nr:translation elongation factor Ts [Candidatus Spechtbacteria bacterium]
MSISAQQVQELRQASGAGVMDVKQALEEAGGDIQIARDILRKKGMIKAAKKMERETHEGRVEAYIHANNKVGVLLKLYCETDFVAQNEQFAQLAHDLVLHIAASNPQYVSPADVPAQILDNERRIYTEQLQGLQKPTDVLAQIIEGKIEKFMQEVALTKQPFVKDLDKTVEDVINEAIAKIGENIQIGGFVRYEL